MREPAEEGVVVDGHSGALERARLLPQRGQQAALLLRAEQVGAAVHFEGAILFRYDARCEDVPAFELVRAQALAHPHVRAAALAIVGPLGVGASKCQYHQNLNSTSSSSAPGGGASKPKARSARPARASGSPRRPKSVRASNAACR